MRKYGAIICVSVVCLLLCVPAAQAKNYAVLISAGQATRDDAVCNSEYWYDMLLQYTTLLDEGYSHDDIHVLYGHGTDFNSKYACYQVPYTVADYAVSRANIQSLFNTLSGVIKEGDFFYVWWMGHGGKSGNNLRMVIETTGESVYDYEFASWVDRITDYDTRGFSWMTCHSGGILDDLEKKPRSIVMSSATFEQSTASDWLCDSYHAEFHYPETCAWHWETPCGICGGINADTNGNGRVSYSEAFTWAKNHTTHSTPQISDLSGLAPDTYLGGVPGCTGDEMIKKTKCKEKRGVNVLRVKLVKGSGGDSFTVKLDSGEEVNGTLNGKGKGKAKFKGLSSGPGKATATWGCGAEDTKDYACP